MDGKVIDCCVVLVRKWFSSKIASYQDELLHDSFLFQKNERIFDVVLFCNWRAIIWKEKEKSLLDLHRFKEI